MPGFVRSTPLRDATMVVATAMCNVAVARNAMEAHARTDEHIRKREKTQYDPDWCMIVQHFLLLCPMLFINFITRFIA